MRIDLVHYLFAYHTLGKGSVWGEPKCGEEEQREERGGAGGGMGGDREGVGGRMGGDRRVGGEREGMGMVNYQSSVSMK